VVQGLPAFSDPNLLVGTEHFGDAGVYRLAPDLAIVQSTDFFAPLVDDPYLFGQIAAANAMSDIFAMGAEVRTALNMVCFPDKDAELSVLSAILSGGAERVANAGGVIVGGHSIRDSEIKYGLAVTGVVHPDRMITNEGARPGDVLVRTKALGTGFITTAHRRQTCPEDVLHAACQSMTLLNLSASRAAVESGAHAATDVTGFGLAGHAYELAEASDVTLEISLESIPILTGASDLAEAGNLTGANRPNLEFVSRTIRVDAGVDLDSTLAGFLFDPQTSGGLLVAIPESAADDFIARCRAGGSSATTRIGRVVEPGDGRLHIAL